MKNIEIKQIATKSVFKVTIYLLAVPLALFFLIGIVLIIIGAVGGPTQFLWIGIIYTIMPFIMLILYGVIGMLQAWLYNKFTKKFGGLQITVSDVVQNDESKVIAE